MITKYSIFVNVWMRLYLDYAMIQDEHSGMVHLYNLNVVVISNSMHDNYSKWY